MPHRLKPFSRSGRFGDLNPSPQLALVDRVVPGGWWVGGLQAARVQALLGSCVSVVVWHQAERIGGMCHFILGGRIRGPSPILDARFADEAVTLMTDALRQRSSAPWGQFEAHIFGGADSFQLGPLAAVIVGQRNVAVARQLVDSYGFHLAAEDVLDTCPRTVTLDTQSGVVTCARTRSIGSPA